MKALRSFQTRRHPAMALLFVCSLILFLGSLQYAQAQADQGAVTGTVTDTTGAVISHAQVTLTNPDTGLSLQAFTNDSGVYVFQPVKIGRYVVRGEAPNFSPATQKGLTLSVQQRLTVDLRLSPGSTSETVLVSSSAPIIQSEEGSTGQVFSTITINQTPLPSRNWVFMAQLSAGVVPSNGSRGTGQGDFSANGQREEQNNFILDGVDNNSNIEDFQNGASFIVRPPPDAMAEFRVQTGSYNAEFGHSAGAVVNASIKSGTNAFHGDLWEYWRNDKLQARDALPYTKIIPEYRLNQFGLTLGGPLVRNKLFFFADTEIRRQIQGSLSTATVPTALMRTGNFTELLNPSFTGYSTAGAGYLFLPQSAGGPSPSSYRTDESQNPYVQKCNGQVNVYCAGQMNAVAQKILSLYPLPTSNAALSNNYTTILKKPDNIAQFDVRFDWNASARDQAFVRYSFANQRALSPGVLGPVLDGGGNITGNVSENFVLSETHLFTERIINEARIGYNYGRFIKRPYNAAAASQQQSLGLGGIPAEGGLPKGNINGITTFGTGGYNPSFEGENVAQLLDNLSWVKGNHAIKLGMNIQWLRVSAIQPPAGFGSYTFSGTYTSAIGVPSTGSGIADFLVNRMTSASVNPIVSTRDVRYNRAFYAQDDWKVTSKLTLNLGVRYENPDPYYESHDRQAQYYPTGTLLPGSGAANFVLPNSQKNSVLPATFLSYLAQDHISLVYSGNRRLIESSKINFAPRIGFAYSVLPQFVVRGGYGIFYGGLEAIGYGVNLAQNVPFNFTSNVITSQSCSFGNGCPTNGLSLNTGFSSQVATGLLNSITSPSLTGADPKQKVPYSEQFNLSTQYGLTKDLAMTVDYVGSVSRHLQVEYDINRTRALLANGTNTQNYRPFPHFGNTQYTQSAGQSSYNSLQAKLEQRPRKGLSFIASYTYAHSLDNAQADLAETSDLGYRAPGIIPLSYEQSNSGFDVRHRFTLTGGYDVPYGAGRSIKPGTKVQDLVAGGWSTSLTFRAQTGFPFSLYPANVATLSGLANAYPAVIHDPLSGGGVPDASNPTISCPTKVRTTVHWFNPCAFRNPASGVGAATVTTAEAALPYAPGKRYNVYGPGYERIDMSLFKSFTTFGEHYLQLRADVFNLLNTPSYAIPSQNNVGNLGGQITSVNHPVAGAPDARFFQLAAKYVF